MAANALAQALGVDQPVAIGDTVVLTIALYKDGAAYSPTVSAAEFNLKDALDDADSAALISKTLGAGVAVSTSTATVTIAAANWASAGITASATLFWALKLTESSGTVTTVAAGTMTVQRTAVLAI